MNFCLINLIRISRHLIALFVIVVLSKWRAAMA
jgi:hypothetical protein